jgi:MoxR-like ATPase
MSNETIFVTIEKSGQKYLATDSAGKDWTSDIELDLRKSAFNDGTALQLFDADENMWVHVPMSMVELKVDFNAEIKEAIANAPSIKPTRLFISDLKWKYLVRTAKRGKNLMLTGPAGCGKTLAAKSLAAALELPFFNFNLGATQDPRSALIGNVHYKQDQGTYFADSEFIRAIQTKDAIILLDELSRANPEAWNILMTPLDMEQRYIRLDERDDQAVINVAEGVTFVATANIGNEYTSTRTMDWALMDRFTVIEMDLLDKNQEFDLLHLLFDEVDTDTLKNVAEVVHQTRNEVFSDSGKLTSFISTRTSVELASLLYDGFTFEEAFEASVYAQYDAEGGPDSERTYLKQIVQKFIPADTGDEPGRKNLFTNDDFGQFMKS